MQHFSTFHVIPSATDASQLSVWTETVARNTPLLTEIARLQSENQNIVIYVLASTSAYCEILPSPGTLLGGIHSYFALWRRILNYVLQ